LKRIAIVDGASFVLPYDHALATGLAARGFGVSFFGSRTRYNEEFLRAMAPAVDVHAQDVSRTVATRWRGVLGYARLLGALWRERSAFAAVNLQFSILWPLELPLLWLLRRRFVFTVHNAVPHGFAARRHAPTAWLAAIARRLVFVSETTRDEFLRRYGETHRAKASVLPHGLLPLVPSGAPVAPQPRPAPEALVFWSNVFAYKGVDLFRDLVHSPAWQAQGLPLEVWGTWSHELHALRDELKALGVTVVDRYLNAAELQALFARNVVFVLPYHRASQSGALYTLLNQGCTVVCSDVGDLGSCLRRFGLQALLLRARGVDAVVACLDALRRDAAGICRALAAAQQQLCWSVTLAGAAAAYGLEGTA